MVALSVLVAGCSLESRGHTILLSSADDTEYDVELRIYRLDSDRELVWSKLVRIGTEDFETTPGLADDTEYEIVADVAGLGTERFQWRHESGYDGVMIPVSPDGIEILGMEYD